MGIKTVTQGKWGVSFQTSSRKAGVTLHVEIMRENLPSGRRFVFQRGQGDGMVFATSEEAHRYALDHGYVQRYYAGPTCPHCNIVHTFLGHRSGFCDVTKQFI